jgi:tetratricopeptide (TPR) repeat protein
MTTLKKKKKKNKSFKQSAMRIDPQIFDAVDQALEIAERGKVSDAEKIISELLKQHPNIHIVQYAMGVICIMNGQYDESTTYFDKAIEIYPHFVEAWFNKASSHQKKLEIEEMIQAFQKVVELGDPTQNFVRDAKTIIANLELNIRKEHGLTLDAYFKGWRKFKEAFASMEQGEWEKALRGFQEVLAIDPKHTQSYGNMGICYAQLGYKQKALEAFDKALEIDPEYAPALLNRAQVSALNEGEKLKDEIKFTAIDYYKETSR